jgi:hypothetical protein
MMIRTIRRLLFPTKQEREVELDIENNILGKSLLLKERVAHIRATLDSERDWLRREEMTDCRLWRCVILLVVV